MNLRTAFIASAMSLTALVSPGCLRGPADDQAQIFAGLKQLPVAVNEVSVTIKDFAFDPADLKIKKGTTVRFTNQDSAPHTVAPDKSGNFAETEVMTTGKSATVKFDDLGTVDYKCGIHPSMKGKVTVGE